jgi:aminomethyltransferase
MWQTPLHGEYAASGGKVVDFHGWALPVQFAGIVQEHLHTRTKAGLFDCSHMGEFILKGAAALEALDRLVYSDMRSLRVGLCRYSAILNEQGGIIDDCVGLRLAEDEIYLVTNAGPLDEVAALFEGVPGVTNVSTPTAKIDLQGPLSRGILLEAGLDCVRDMKYWNGQRTQWRGADIVITRAGYTGELGYEIFAPSELGPELWRTLVAHPDVAPCGLGARDTLRTEVGYPLNGEDLAQDLTPLECGMERFIAWDSEFPGKARIAAQREADDYHVLVAIKTADRRSPRHAMELTTPDGAPAGVVTSGTFGPSVGTGVGLARVPKAYAAPGTALLAGTRALPVEVAEIPIYKDGTCRVKL